MTAQLAGDIVRAKQFAATGLTVSGLFAGWVARAPDKAFLIWAPFEGEDRTYSYAAFWELAGRVAAGLAARGLGAGDRLMLHMDNCPEFLLVWLACVRLGVVVVTTNTRSGEDEIVYFAEKSRAVAVVTQVHYLHHFRAAPTAPGRLLIASGEPQASAKPEQARVTAFSELLEQGRAVELDRAGFMDDMSVQFTSGTTARPKGVIWTQANAIWGAQLNARHFALRHDDVCLVHLPLFHTNAQSYSLLGTLWVGGTAVLQPRFSARHFWRPALAHRATWSSMIPFCVKALLEQPVPEQHDFRLWVPAVAMPSLADQRFGLTTMGLWGMTETVTQGIVGDPHHPGPDMCIGRPSPGYDIRVLDEDGRSIGPGEAGDLSIRGVTGISLFKEYLDDPAATAASFDADGWFATGDRVRMGAHGELYFMDRAKDMLKVGGENVSAAEIEAAIFESGLVSDCAVVAQKHHMLDEVPVAFVVPGAGAGDDLEAQLIAHCRTRLADFKVIRAVHVVEALPRGTLEKVAKQALRARLADINADQCHGGI
ncbi:MAG: ATP-dependent acyl-CoA ligase [Variovorax sp.]|nr:MAG: ATP-dependent acyl-CoA ligase [Variovorax sp.]